MPFDLNVLERLADIDVLITQARAIPLEGVNALLAQLDKEETLMPLLDPTAWINRPKALEKRTELLRAFVMFRRAIEQED